jgi:hypothetical protein
MRLNLKVATAVLAGLMMVAVVLPGSASADKSCGTIKVGYNGKPTKFKVFKAGRVTCHKAKLLTRAIRSGARGWKYISRIDSFKKRKWICGEGSGGGYCKNRKTGAEANWGFAALFRQLVATTSHAPESSSPANRKMCAGNRGDVPGTGGIYSLRSRNVSCSKARKVVKKFHTKYNRNYESRQRARGFSCKSHPTGGYEGLIVSCKRGSKIVKWTAYLEPMVGYSQLAVRGRFSPPPGTRRCGTFRSSYRIHVYAKKISCKKARRIQKTYWRGPDSGRVVHNGGTGAYGWITLKKFPGYRCTSGAGGGVCKKGNKEAWYLN